VNFEDARAAIATRLDAGMTATYPAVPVVYENHTKVDLATQTAPYVRCDVVFNDGEQASIELTPLARYRGATYLAVYAKEGQGTKAVLQILAYLAGLFKSVKFSGVQSQVAVPMPGAEKDGWYYVAIRIPFWFDDLP